jgi:hypothetical protein
MANVHFWCCISNQKVVIQYVSAVQAIWDTIMMSLRQLSSPVGGTGESRHRAYVLYMEWVRVVTWQTTLSFTYVGGGLKMRQSH